MKQALIVVTALLAGAPALGQDAVAGAEVFKKCAACHQVGDGAKNRTGPVLTGVVGRPAGAVEGFKYSRSMQEAGAAGLVWEADLIFDYIQDPTAFLRQWLNDPKARAKMSFKLKDAQDRRDVIAYLAGFSPQSSAAVAPDDAGTPAAQTGVDGGAGMGDAVHAMAPPDAGFCVLNTSGKAHVFATQTREGSRQLATLAPGERLCAPETGAPDGIVSVYESVDSFEGCSRIVPAGAIEEMHQYAEFDRCVWSAHQS